MMDPTAMLACAMCKDVVAGLKSQLAEGFFWSILFMLTMPFALLGVITWRVISALRRKTS